jgi:hypothetical protein
MTTSSNKPPRQRVWKPGPVDGSQMGEFSRDIAQQIGAFPKFQLTERKIAYNPPFYLASDNVPKGVVIMRCRPTGGVTITPAGMVHWEWTGSQVKVNAIDNLVAGTQYIMTFMLVG